MKGCLQPLYQCLVLSVWVSIPYLLTQYLISACKKEKEHSHLSWHRRSSRHFLGFFCSLPNITLFVSHYPFAFFWRRGLDSVLLLKFQQQLQLMLFRMMCEFRKRYKRFSQWCFSSFEEMLSNGLIVSEGMKRQSKDGRLLCMVFSSGYSALMVLALNSTWLSRCDHFHFLLDTKLHSDLVRHLFDSKQDNF